MSQVFMEGGDNNVGLQIIDMSDCYVGEDLLQNSIVIEKRIIKFRVFSANNDKRKNSKKKKIHFLHRPVLYPLYIIL